MTLGAFENGVDIGTLTAAYVRLANSGIYKELSFIKE